MENGPESGNLDEIEVLATKAYQIFKEKKIKGRAVTDLAQAFDVLVETKFLNDDYGHETKSLLDDFCNFANRYLGQFYQESLNILQRTRICDNDTKRRYVQKSESCYKEGLRTGIRWNGPNHPFSLQAWVDLS
jgi:hypothetical protein